jgi:hypothetical protein
MHGKTLTAVGFYKVLPGVTTLFWTAAACTFAPQPLVLSLSKDEQRECPG